MRKIGLSLFLLSIGCSHSGLESDRVDLSPSLAAGESHQALISCDKIEEQEPEALGPSSQGLLRLAQCDLLEERWSAAKQKLEATLRMHSGRRDQIEALSLFHLAEVHYQEGDLSKFAAYLKDAQARASALPPWVREVELPLRLAQKNLRLGRISDSHGYRESAQEQLKSHRNAGSLSPEVLGRILYSIGYYRWQSTDSMEDYFKQADYWSWSQVFLVELIELGAEEWSDRGARLMLSNYRSMLEDINSWPRDPASDGLASDRKKQESQWEMAYQALYMLEHLGTLPLEPQGMSPHMKEVFGQLAHVEKQLLELYNQRPIGSGLTPASQERQRSLRTLNPIPLLEGSRSLEDGDVGGDGHDPNL